MSPAKVEFTAAAFWARVEVGDVEKCWPWKCARLEPDGYGQVWWGEKTAQGRPKPSKCHRVAYALAHGPIPTGLLVRHSCDYKPCCNPSHLLVGDVKDNSHDALRRGRVPVKLARERVPELRARHAAGESVRALARVFGISKTVAHRIALGLDAPLLREG